PFVNAVYRRWTARKGWRENDPERGLFILEENPSITPHLPAHLVYVELCADGFKHSLTEDLTQGRKQALFGQAHQLDRMGHHVRELKTGDISDLRPHLEVFARESA